MVLITPILAGSDREVAFLGCFSTSVAEGGLQTHNQSRADDDKAHVSREGFNPCRGRARSIGTRGRLELEATPTIRGVKPRPPALRKQRGVVVQKQRLVVHL
jgi:hypothetical protein